VRFSISSGTLVQSTLNQFSSSSRFKLRVAEGNWSLSCHFSSSDTTS
jgi:hypothetical protein